MSVFLLRRGDPNPPPPPPIEVSVSVTGTGNFMYCFAMINGSQYTAAASGILVQPGDKITFAVYGYSSTYYGAVTIDGVQAIRVTNRTTQQYEWTVPDNISTVTIAMSYTSTSSRRNGKITVTTE